jgi:hypothetical protein
MNGYVMLATLGLIGIIVMLIAMIVDGNFKSVNAISQF